MIDVQQLRDAAARRQGLTQTANDYSAGIRAKIAAMPKRSPFGSLLAGGAAPEPTTFAPFPGGDQQRQMQQQGGDPSRYSRSGAGAAAGKPAGPPPPTPATPDPMQRRAAVPGGKMQLGADTLRNAWGNYQRRDMQAGGTGRAAYSR